MASLPAGFLIPDVKEPGPVNDPGAVAASGPVNEPGPVDDPVPEPAPPLKPEPARLPPVAVSRFGFVSLGMLPAGMSRVGLL